MDDASRPFGSKALRETKAMKRHGHLFEKIIDIDNCKQAILEAAKGKRNRERVRHYVKNVDFYAIDLSKRLERIDFTTPYTFKTIKDGLSGKERELQIPSFFPDQCAHHAIVQVLMPIIIRSSYHWSCANIPRRGIDRACIGVERATRKDRKHAKYCVKLDIKKFYPSIDHETLMNAVKHKVKDKRAVAVIKKVVDSHDKGLPIGNYTSPWLAEWFLQPLDRFILSRDGVRHYIRYADDMVIIGSNKRKLRRCLFAVMEFLKPMKLSLKENYQLFKIYRDGKGRKIDFVGKCFGIGVTTVRKRRALAFMRHSRMIRRLMRKGEQIYFRTASGFISRSSCLRYTNSAGLRKAYFETVDISYLKEVIRHESYRRQCAGTHRHRESTTA